MNFHLINYVRSINFFFEKNFNHIKFRIEYFGFADTHSLSKGQMNLEFALLQYFRKYVLQEADFFFGDKNHNCEIRRTEIRKFFHSATFSWSDLICNHYHISDFTKNTPKRYPTSLPSFTARSQDARGTKNGIRYPEYVFQHLHILISILSSLELNYPILW